MSQEKKSHKTDSQKPTLSKRNFDLQSEEGVDIQVLLNPKNTEALAKLIPKLGKRLSFIRKVEEHCLDQDFEEKISESIESVCSGSINISDIIVLPVEAEDLSSQIKAAPEPFPKELDNLDASLATTSTNCESVPAKKKKTSISNVDDFDLRNLLNTTSVGKALLAWHGLKGGLDSTKQSYLVDIISSEFINKGYTHLTNNEFKILSEKIVEVFPLEIEETYFLPPVRKRDSFLNKAGVAKGKLVDKFRNKLTFLREVGILPARTKENQREDEMPIEEPCDDDIIWLRDNRGPLQEVYDHWDRCFTFRRQNTLKLSDVEAIFTSYPILKEPLCLPLIARDFERIYPKKPDVKSSFEQTFHKLSKLRGSSLSSVNDKILLDLIHSEAIQEDYKHYVMLTLLPALLPNKSRHVYGRSRKLWKPSVADARNGIIIKAEVPGDVKIKIKQKVEKLDNLELPVQPFLVVVGSRTTIDKIYVYINRELYQVGTVLSGLDFCFKSYHVFHVRYQLEAEYVWLFIQIGIYDIKSKWDTAIPNILDIANKVKRS